MIIKSGVIAQIKDNKMYNNKLLLSLFAAWNAELMHPIPYNPIITENDIDDKSESINAPSLDFLCSIILLAWLNIPFGIKNNKDKISGASIKLFKITPISMFHLFIRISHIAQVMHNGRWVVVIILPMVVLNVNNL